MLAPPVIAALTLFASAECAFPPLLHPRQAFPAAPTRTTVFTTTTTLSSCSEAWSSVIGAPDAPGLPPGGPIIVSWPTCLRNSTTRCACRTAPLVPTALASEWTSYWSSLRIWKTAHASELSTLAQLCSLSRWWLLDGTECSTSTSTLSGSRNTTLRTTTAATTRSTTTTGVGPVSVTESSASLSSTTTTSQGRAGPTPTAAPPAGSGSVGRWELISWTFCVVIAIAAVASS